MKKALTAAVLAAWIVAIPALAFFGPEPQLLKVILTRANTYEACLAGIDVFATNANLVGVQFYDAGDVADQITTNYGGSPTDTFACAWPVTIYAWFKTNNLNPYHQARLQFFEGTNTLSSSNWTDICSITNFQGVVNVQGAHFGLVTWYPPATNNVYYLIRCWSILDNGIENGPLDATNIDKDGGSGWHDYDVMLIRTLRYKKPGSRGSDAILTVHGASGGDVDGMASVTSRKSILRVAWEWLARFPWLP